MSENEFLTKLSKLKELNKKDYEFIISIIEKIREIEL